jgi:hypothetical protein
MAQRVFSQYSNIRLIEFMLVLTTSLILLILFFREYSTVTPKKQTYELVFFISVICFNLAIRIFTTSNRLSFTFLLLGIVWITSVIALRIKQNSHLYNKFIILPGFIFTFLIPKFSYQDVHAYESYANANLKLFQSGFLPWRDFHLEHGIWEDLLRPLLARVLAGQNYAGQQLGLHYLVIPLELFLVAILLFSISKSLTLVLSILSVNQILIDRFGPSVNGYYGLSLNSMSRTLPILLLSYLLLKLYDRLNLKNIFLLGIASSLCLLWSQENIYGILGVTLAIFLLLRGNSFFTLNSFKIVSVYFSTVLMFFFGILQIFNLLTPWIARFRIDSDGFQLAWGMPFNLKLGLTYVFLVICIPAILLFFAARYFAILENYKESKKIDVYLALLPFAGLMFGFYLKFLQWPDWHIFQPAVMLLFIISIWLAKSVKIDFKNKNYALTAIALLVCLPSFANQVQPKSQDTVYLKNFGNVTKPTSQYIARVNKVGMEFSKYLKRDSGEILDLGNEPVTWFDILDYTPSNGITKVINYYSAKSQKVLIKNLQKNPPSAVIWGGEFGYFDSVVAPTYLKQYLITEFVFDNYKPVSYSGRYVLFLPKQSPEPVNGKALKLVREVPCNYQDSVDKFHRPYRNSLNIEILQPQSLNSLNQKVKNSKIQVKMYKQGGMNSIDFNLNSYYPAQKLWLGACPNYVLNRPNSDWVFKTDPNITDLKIKNLDTGDYFESR